LSRTNSTYQASPQNFFPFSYGKTIGESAPDDFLYVKENHLGNVLTVVSDRKLGVDNVNNTTGVAPPDGLVDYYLADVVSAKDYYAFGWEMPGRSFNPDEYPNSYNGKRDDRELNDWQDYGERMYMKRLGRFPTPDPITRNFPSLSPYQYAGNSPIQSSDIDGLEQGAPAGESGLMGVPTLVHAQDVQIQGTIIVQYQKLNAHANTTSLAAQNASNAKFLADPKKAGGEITQGLTQGQRQKQAALNRMGALERHMVQHDPITNATARGVVILAVGAVAGEAIGAAIPALTRISVGGVTAAKGFGSALGDAGFQYATTGKVNITQSAAQFGFSFLRNPAVSAFGSAAAGSAGELNVQGGTLTYGGLGGGKSLERFGFETALGGLGNLAASSGAGFLSGSSPYQPVSYGGQQNMSFFTNLISTAGAGVAGQAVDNELNKQGTVK